MKAIRVPIQSMHLIDRFDKEGSVERGRIIQEHFDELSIEMLMKYHL